MDMFVILSGIATGFVLGLLGSGGSIIALPALIYLLGVAPKAALAMSLGVVGVTATLAAVNHGRRGNVDAPVALAFALFGVAGTYVGTRVGVATPAVVQLTLFALVMYTAAWRMLRRPSAKPQSAPALNFNVSGGAAALGGCPEVFSPCMVKIALAAVGVGLLTGLVGVGGGFLIVPALVLFSGLPMKKAVGTSLAIVAANAYAGFYGYLGTVPVDWPLMGGFVSMTLLGSLLGTWASSRLSHETLKSAFGAFLILVASYILIKNGLFA